MDEFFGGMDVISITDSTMMRIAHAGMNKAHERVKSKEGAIERLNEISKFYELAVMQLEGCLKFVQEESCHEEELLAGLVEIRNRLKGRLGESEVAIAEKDRELAERAESEVRLRQALEVKERELASLKGKFERTRTSRDGEFCELKNSVDQQVWNIRQKLEPDYNGRFGDDRGGGVGDEKIEQMGSDIDALKETLDLAFGKMRNAIFLSEVAPIEQQWRWGVEKDMLCVLIRGLVRDVHEMFEAKNWSSQWRKDPVGFDDFWPCLMDEVAGLKSELNSLLGEPEVVVVPGKSGSSSLANLILGEVNNDEGEDAKHYVAKMIKNHESIIRKKSTEAEELSLLRREVMREKVLSSCKREKEPDSLKKRVQEVIAKLDSFVEWKENLCESFGDRSDTNDEKTAFDTLEDAWESMDKVCCDVNEELPKKNWKLEEELEELNLKTKLMEETYIALFEGLSKDLKLELCRCEGICKDLVAEMKNQWNENIQSNNAESQIREDIYCVVFNEVIKDFRSVNYLEIAESEHASDENNGSKDSEFSDILNNIKIEGTIREHIDWLVFGEIVKDLNKNIEAYDTDALVIEEIGCIVFDETVKSIVDNANSALRQREEAKLAEDSVKDDVIKETMKEWKMKLDEYSNESLITEEMFHFVVLEAAKDTFVRFKDAANEDKLLGCNICDDKLKKCRHFGTPESSIQNVGYLQKYQDVEEHSMLCIGTELKENAVGLNPVGLECETLGKKNTSSSESSELEKAQQKLAASKETLHEMASSLGLVFGDGPRTIHHQKTCTISCVQDRESSIVNPKVRGKKQLDQSDSEVTPLLGFFQVMVDFEHVAREKLEMNTLRLEELNHNLIPLVETISSLREKESVYRRAFIRRCQNLHKAETEVDLLGDQVEVLLGLLQKIHTTLQHHSSFLHQNVWLSELLKLIKKELNGVIHATKH